MADQFLFNSSGKAGDALPVEDFKMNYEEIKVSYDRKNSEPDLGFEVEETSPFFDDVFQF